MSANVEKHACFRDMPGYDVALQGAPFSVHREACGEVQVEQVVMNDAVAGCNAG